MTDAEIRPQLPPDLPPDVLVLTVSQTARLLSISRGGAYALVARNELPHVRLGRRIVVPRIALERFLDEMTRGAVRAAAV